MKCLIRLKDPMILAQISNMEIGTACKKTLLCHRKFGHKGAHLSAKYIWVDGVKFASRR